MRSGQLSGRPTAGWRVAVVGALGWLSACTGGAGGGDGPESPAGASPSLEIGHTRYFDDPSFVGQPATVTGRVTRVITPTSFVLDARDHGDDSLLVLSQPRSDLAEGGLVEVDGRVEVFDHATYADEFDLAAAGRYDDFAGEQFVAAAQPDPSPQPATTTRRP